MIAFSVLKSFGCASVRNEQIIINEDDRDTQSGESDSSFLTPSVENVILAPYNFNFS